MDKDKNENENGAGGTKSYASATFKKLERSEVEIEAEIPAEILEQKFKKVLKNAVASAEIQGFRAGKAPEQIVLKNLGELNILERAAREALDEAYPHIVNGLNIRAIGAPTIAVTKLARGNPLGFRARTAVMPEVLLGDYKKIASEVKIKNADEAKVPADEKEVDRVIEDMRKALAGHTHHEHGHGHDNHSDGEQNKPHIHELPEVNDEFAAKFGNFKSVDELRKNIAESLMTEKERASRDARRAEIAEKILASATIEVPEFFIESELESMIKRFENDVTRSGMTLEAYLSGVKKTLDDVKKEWRSSAEKKARLELVLAHIARTEDIKPDEERVKKEVDHIVAAHKDADRFQARQYIEHILKNEAVFDFLEKQAG